MNDTTVQLYSTYCMYVIALEYEIAGCCVMHLLLSFVADSGVSSGLIHDGCLLFVSLLLLYVCVCVCS